MHCWWERELVQIRQEGDTFPVSPVFPEEIQGPSSPSAPDLCKPQLTGPNALPGLEKGGKSQA